MKHFKILVIFFLSSLIPLSCSDDNGDLRSGSLDRSFNETGIVTETGAAGAKTLDQGSCIKVNADGKIFVAGGSMNPDGNSDIAIWSFNEDGRLNTLFGGTGVVTHDNTAGGNANDVAYSLVIDSTGRILVTGASVNAQGLFDMVILRYLADGTLDTSFNNTGIVVDSGAAGGKGFDQGRGITLDSSGRIMITGYSTNPAGGKDMVLWRFNTDGTPDTTFNNTGYVVSTGTAGGGGPDKGLGVAVDASGKILVTGWSTNGDGLSDMVTWRYNPDGTPDETFNGTGFVISSGVTGGDENAKGLAITTDASNKILVTGLSRTPAGYLGMVIWRYDTDGLPDTTLAGTGFVLDNNAAGGDLAGGLSIVIDSLGRILVAGSGTNSTGYRDMVVWRYNPDGTRDTSFNGKGFVAYHVPAETDGDVAGHSVWLDAQGRILVTGVDGDRQKAFMNIWRLIP